MKNASKSAREFASLLKRLGDAAEPELPDADDPVSVLVLSFLLWDSGTEKAVAAYRHILRHVVDFNDLRVCMPQETVDMIGVRYPRALDRCQRLRAVLRDIYVREHAVSLERLRELGKRDVRKYLDSLEGMVPYVTARVALLSFDAHAIPVDDQLRTQLIELDIADASVEVPELASWLERQIKASDGRRTHFALQNWIDLGGAVTTRGRAGRAGRKTVGKTSRKKKTTRKASTNPKTKKKAVSRAGG